MYHELNTLIPLSRSCLLKKNEVRRKGRKKEGGGKGRMEGEKGARRIGNINTTKTTVLVTGSTAFTNCNCASTITTLI